MPLPRIGLTVGDPAGIGPEVAIAAARDLRVLEVCEPVLYGPHTELECATFLHGRPSAEAGRAAYEAVRAATSDAVSGRLDAITTAPISKEAWDLAGLPWLGHTDLLAHLTGVTDVAMLFHAERLRVVLATVHVPLRDVPRLLTRERIERVIDLAHVELPHVGFAHPRLAMAGVNPHAGECGLIGKEEVHVVKPAVEACRARGIDITGPLPGDTVFARAFNGDFDAVVACYHDQGLIPVKLVAFGQAVNVTLGLPIVRTSVDHGTAFDIVGQGLANPSSMVQATLLAAKLVAARTQVVPLS